MIESTQRTVCCCLVLLAIMGLGGSADAEDGLWMTNYEQARKKAAQTGKGLLMDFSGSDWCTWCIKLDEEVFSHDVFKETATKDFVLVLLDYPHNKSKIPPEIQAQNEQLKQKHGIQGYPTVILADAKGRPYAKTGYQAGGPETYLRHLAELRQKGTEIAKYLKQAAAPDLKPVDRVRLLDKAVDGIDLPLLVEFYGDVVDRIMTLDTDNKAGIKEKYELRIRVARAEKALGSRNTKKAIELYEAIIHDFQPTGEQAQSLYFSLSEAHFGAKHMDKAKAGLEKALQAAPESKTAARIKMIMEQYFSDAVKE